MNQLYLQGAYQRHWWIATGSVVVGASSLVVFRLLMELGFGLTGSLRIDSIPLEYIALLWYWGLLALLASHRGLHGARLERQAVYHWCWGVLGVAGAAWLLRERVDTGRLPDTASVYWLTGVGGFLVMASASALPRPQLVATLRSFPHDAAYLLSRPATWAAAVCALCVLALAPRSYEIPEGGRPFERWYSRQASVAVPAEWRKSPVTLVELIDYQCPVCRRAEREYGNLIADARARYGDGFAFLRVDFPLDSECNAIGPEDQGLALHPAACEAAVAMHLARMHGPDVERKTLEWLWSTQAELTPALVAERAEATFGIVWKERYPDLLPFIRRQADAGRQLGVSGTPTFFLNGRRLPFLGPSAMAQAIALEYIAVTGDSPR